MFSFMPLLPLVLTASAALSAAVDSPTVVTATHKCALPRKLAIPGLPPPIQQSGALDISWVGLAVGIQNYTCSTAGTFTNVGAVAELFDISCFVSNPLFDVLPNLAISAWEAAPEGLAILDLINDLRRPLGAEALGQHYFVPNPITGTGINAKWDFTSGALKGDANAFVVAARNSSAPAPTGSQDIDWVFLTGLAGNSELAAQVFRTDTRLGQPPANCTVGSPDISVKYAAKYWGYGESVML